MIKEIIKNPNFVNIILVIAMMFGGKIVLKLFEKFIKKFFEENERKHPLNTAKAETVSKALYSVVRFIIVFIILLIIMDMLGINTRSIIATAGVGGIAIAFGAQTIIQDFIKGMFMIIDDMLRVGDFVECAGVSGTVESVGLRLTRIRDYDGSLHTIPNSQIQNIKNFDRGPQKAEVYFNISYDVSLNQIKEIIEIISEKISKLEGLENVFVEKLRFMEINDLGEFSYKVRITSTVLQDKQYEVRRKARELLKEEFEKRNIKSSILENK